MKYILIIWLSFTPANKFEVERVEVRDLQTCMILKDLAESRGLKAACMMEVTYD